MTASITSSPSLEAATSSPRNRRRWFRHPLIAICGLQAALSLSLIWSNTAFSDEADYLWLGHLEIAHWLHGTTWPAAYGEHVLSGSPIIYPPIGALADSVGGLAGARILSLIFMLGATVLLYLTASKLFGYPAALFSSAIWAMTEPTLRLAFATYDPLAILLTSLSAWLVVQAGYRRHRGEFIAAAAIVLAFATATTYSVLVVVPFVFAFAFLVWLGRTDVRQAAFGTAWFVGGSVVIFAVLMSASRSWQGLSATVLDRSITDRQSDAHVFGDVWGWSWLVMCIAATGIVAAVFTEGRQRSALLAVLGGAAFVVPAAQLWQHTSVSLDKHLDYGIWFGAMAGGYACTRLVQWRSAGGKPLIVVCCAIALSYVGLNAWEAASQVYQGWPNSRGYVAALRPIAAQTSGLIFSAGQDHIGEYYTPQGSEWTRWSAALQLDPTSVPKDRWPSYYRQQLDSGRFGVIALFYSTSVPAAQLQPNFAPPSDAGERYPGLQGLVSAGFGQPGVPDLTQALAADPGYDLRAQGRYSNAHGGGIFAIWQRVQP